jgi:hypothetical protein
VVDQVRALLRQPEIVVGTWLAARIVRALVERVVVGPAGADIRLRVEGLAGLVRDLTAIVPEALRAAA